MKVLKRLKTSYLQGHNGRINLKPRFLKMHFTFCLNFDIVFLLNSISYDEKTGTAVAQWLGCCATNRKVAGSIPAGATGFFIGIKYFRSHYGPGVDSASNRSEYQEHFLGGKGGRCVRLTTLPPPCAVVTKSGNLNFLEPSGPVQASNGTALLFILRVDTQFLIFFDK